MSAARLRGALSVRTPLGGLAVAAALLAAFAPTDAQAQFGRRGGFGGGFQPAALRELARDSIVQELKLTEEQQAKVRELAETPPENAEELGAIFEALREAQTDEERAAIRAEMQNLNEARDLKVEEQLRGILNETQATRLEQIVLHRTGPGALTRADRADKLKLTPEQRQQLSDLSAERQAGMFSNFGLSREERQALDQEWNSRFLAVLTDAQQAQWTAWIGPAPPEVPEEERGFGRGFGRRGGGDRSPPGAEPTESPAASASATTAAPAASSAEPAGPAAGSFDASGATEGKLSFNFQSAPWSEVLKDFARRAGLTLEMKDVPPGTFTYFDRKEYTPKQALDVLNGPLLRLGYALVQRDEFLICANIDKGPAPNLIPYITSAELANRGDNELLTVVFSVKGVDDIATLAQQVQEMLGPQGKAVAVQAAGALVVTDLGTNLRRVNDLLMATSALLGPEDVKFQAYPLQHISATEAEQLLRSVLGLRVGVRNVSGASGGDRDRGGRGDRGRGWWRGGVENGGEGDPNVGGDQLPQNSPFEEGLLAKTQFAADPRINQLLVTAPAVVHVLIGEALQKIDVESSTAGGWGRDSQPYLQVYTVRTAGVQEVAKTVDAMMPGVLLNEDGQSNRIHIMGTAAQHREVEGIIRQLDGQGGGQSVAVIPLAKMDPLVASTTLQQMFASDGAGAPTIQADLLGRQVLVRGSSDQIAQVKALLAQLGEDGTGRRSRSAGGTVRRFSLSGRDSERLLDLIDQAWHATQPNRIEVVPAQRSSPVRGFEPPAERETRRPADERPAERGQRGAEEPVSLRTPAGDAGFVAFVDEPAAGDTPTADVPAAEAGKPPVSSEGRDASGERRELAPGIYIQVEGDELILMSEDEAALDRLEQMLEETLQAMPPSTTWTVFTLKSADATEAASMLEQLIPDASVAEATTSSSSSGFLGSISSMGNSLLSASGLNSGPVGGLRIIPEIRLNALFVAGPPSKVQEVRDFLEILDASDWPGTLRDRVPHMIPVQYAEIADVYRVVRDVYSDFINGQPANPGQNNPFAIFMGGGRGGRDQQQPTPQDVRLTVGMDEQTSNLIVSADEGLYQEIRELVTSLDNAARDARRTVRVVELQNASTAAVQNTLGAVMPRVRVSSTGGRSPQRDASSGNTPSTSPQGSNNGGQQQGPSPDQMRQFWEQRIRERMSGGAGGDGQRRSFFFGGDGGRGGDGSRGGDRGGDRGRFGGRN